MVAALRISMQRRGPFLCWALTLSSRRLLCRAEELMDTVNKHVTRVLFCGFDFSSSQKYTREYLQNHPYIQVDDVALDEIPFVIQNYDMCVVKNSRLDAKLIASAVQMKLIMQFGVGLEGVDVNAATKQNIKVGRIPGRTTGNAASCAEMAIYLMLGLLRKQKEMEISVKKKILGDPIGETLFGKTSLGLCCIDMDTAEQIWIQDTSILKNIGYRYGVDMPL
ncbi:uncharacterized protein LOC110104865 [Dendrobium catenatum]|uniref:uncharacterized protein LOC110104865 n=1 Tax=Dendrobium catenatum TaxID=906689 RepID=UPI00109F9967|nr:uncharacterized protein LOC110104865 [Dendrobium catenatum]